MRTPQLSPEVRSGSAWTGDEVDGIGSTASPPLRQHSLIGDDSFKRRGEQNGSSNDEGFILANILVIMIIIIIIIIIQ